MNEPFLFIFGLIVTVLAIGPYVFVVLNDRKSKIKINLTGESRMNNNKMLMFVTSIDIKLPMR